MNRNNFSTLMGFAVAIANAWNNINWKDFDIKKEWPTLFLSALIAVGGIATEIRKKSDQP